MDSTTEAKVQLWKDNVTEADLKAELDGLLAGDEEKLNDAFYRDLAFGHLQSSSAADAVIHST